MNNPDRRQLTESLFDPPKIPKISKKEAAGAWVVVCIHDRLDRAEPCLRSVHERTPMDTGIIIVDDASDDFTAARLRELADEFRNDGRCVGGIRHDENVRYTRAINSGFEAAFTEGAEWAIALNSDTLVTEGWLERMVVAGRGENVGMVCPYMSNAALLTFGMLPGVSYREMARRLAREAAGTIVDAVTPVGACMAVKAALWREVGPFDEERCPQGYGEECHFWAVAVSSAAERARRFEDRKVSQHPWRAVVACDAYVWHESHATYGREAVDRERRAVEDFKREHGNLLEARRAKAVREDPRGDLEVRIRQIRSSGDRPRIYFYLPALQLCGGLLAIGHVINGLIERGIDASIAYNWDKGGLSKVPMTAGALKVGADPSSWRKSGGPQDAIVMATAWFTADWVARLAQSVEGVRPGIFVQDYESMFVKQDGRPEYPRGTPRAVIELAKGPRSVVNSNWVREAMRRDFDAPCSAYIPIGVDTRLFYDRGLRSSGKNRIQVLAMYRPETPRRGDKLLRKLYRQLHDRYGNRVDLATYGSTTIPDGGDYKVTSLGILGQPDLARFHAQAHLLIEPSEMQGWGMPAQEAMVTGACVISTDNGGIGNYGRHDENCLIGSTDKEIFQLACRAIEDDELRERLGYQAGQDMQKFDWSLICDEWARQVNQWWATRS